MESVFGDGTTILTHNCNGRNIFLNGFLYIQLGRSGRYTKRLRVITTLQILAGLCAIRAPTGRIVKGKFPLVRGSLRRHHVLTHMLGRGQVFHVEGGMDTIYNTFLRVMTTGERVKDGKDIVTTHLVQIGKGRFRGTTYQSRTTVGNHRIDKDVRAGEGVFMFLVRTGTRRFVYFWFF